MSKKICTSFFVVCCIIIAFVLVGCNESPASRVNRLAGIKLPSGMEVVYSHVGQVFSGLAEQYTVFQLKEEPTKFLNKHDFSAKSVADVEFRFETHFILGKVPQEHHPDLTSNFLYAEFINKHEIMGLYFPDTLILIMIVWGH